eukprot:7920026-Karenia_brevis.AAC.1
MRRIFCRTVVASYGLDTDNERDRDEAEKDFTYWVGVMRTYGTTWSYIWHIGDSAISAAYKDTWQQWVEVAAWYIEPAVLPTLRQPGEPIQ